ncbi:cytochrome P450 [Aspergillus multicolor]|uniref:cytochrome P450 n=1 Tax=Aspergillus multicolor TaxID=41759 RepID=UPI003CCE247B
MDDVHRELHKQYGPLVRIQPGEIICSGPNAIEIIYGSGSRFKKAWRLSHAINYPGHVVTRNALQKYLVKNVYAMDSILDIESIINKHIQEPMFRNDTSTLYQGKMDLWYLLKTHVYMVLCEMLYGYRFNAVLQLGGLEWWLGAVESLLPSLTADGALPRDYLAKFYEFWDSFDTFRRLLTAILGCESGCTPEYVQKELLAALFGGTEPTNLTLTSTLYHLMRNPDIYQRLTTEIDAAYAERDPKTPISYNEACALPYLKACIQEAMRLHPAVGYHLPRVVPRAEQLSLYDKYVFGADADIFNPDRWLRGNDNGNVEQMEKVMLALGAGDTACPGKKVATCLVYKLIPHLLRNFEVRLTGEKEPVKKIYWFTLLRDVDVAFKKRDVKPKVRLE